MGPFVEYLPIHKVLIIIYFPILIPLRSGESLNHSESTFQ
jgi:hypothetical protein